MIIRSCCDEGFEAYPKDIGWAISMLRKGKRVRRPTWSQHYLILAPPELEGKIMLVGTIASETTHLWSAESCDLLATDWEKCS